MFQWARNLLGFDAPKAATGTRSHGITARYDNAGTSSENYRNWFSADYLSAKAANSYQVRRQLRLRSRYEVSNNPYLWGVCNGNADDLIGTGPTLQCLLSGAGANRQIERAWNEWAEEVGLTEKLRTLKLARTVDGEGFLILKTVPDLDSPVTLYPVDVEADQITTIQPKAIADMWLDGLQLHPITGRPVAYSVLKAHPGDYFFPGFDPLAFEWVKARHVIHWFPKFRPGQVRGVPVFTPALDLFTELRAFRKAVLSNAQIAAAFAAVLESEAPANVGDEDVEVTPFVKANIDRDMMTTLPSGMKLNQLDPKQPATSYEMFQEKCLGEAVRPLAYPLNLALGTSQKFNFSSAKLDHINYRYGLRVERADCETVALNRLFAAWFDEAVMVPGLLPKGLNSVAAVPHEWHWPAFEPLDDVNDAKADHTRLANGTSTYRDFWASRGKDWRDVMAQQAVEREEMERLGLLFTDPLKRVIKEDVTLGEDMQPVDPDEVGGGGGRENAIDTA